MANVSAIIHRQTHRQHNVDNGHAIDDNPESKHEPKDFNDAKPNVDGDQKSSNHIADGQKHNYKNTSNG